MGNINPSHVDLKDSDNSLISTTGVNNKKASQINNQQKKPPQTMQQSNSADKWNCTACTVENSSLLYSCEICGTKRPNTNNNNDDMKTQTNNNNNNNYGPIWCWQDDNAEYIPYPANISHQINALNMRNITTVTMNNMQYQIKRVSKDAAIQTNMTDGHIRLVMLQNNSSSSTDKTFHWYWQNKNSYKPFNHNDSQKIDKLNIGNAYTMYINGTPYEIRKTGKDSAQQINKSTNFKRKVIRKIKSNNNQHNYNDNDNYNRDRNSNNNDENTSDQTLWYWDNNGSYKSYSKDVSDMIHKLKIGESFTKQFGRDSYQITKISAVKCEQKNTRTNFTRNGKLKAQNNDESSDDNDDHKEEKQEPKESWHWKNDKGEFRPCGYNVSKTISQLSIGAMKKIKIHNKWYEFKRTEIGKCDQKNSKTGRIREVRIAIYKWYCKDSKGNFLTYEDNVNKKLEDASIGDTITVSIKSNKYSITKKTASYAEQINLSSQKKRMIFREMSLNHDAKNDSGVMLSEKKVKELFHKTVAKTRVISEVKDLTKNSQNSVIYEKILQEKCKNGRKREKMEKLLWHGTKDLNNLNLIIKNGFDRSFNKAAAYGKGSYFARDASYSVNGYCGKNASGTFSILLCKVIVGDFTVGSSSTVTIPKKPDGSEYDTLVNNKANPSIFVVWRDYHAVPIKLVKFK